MTRAAHGRTLKRTRLGRLLVIHRSTRGIGIRALAAEIGTSAATLSRVERGHDLDARTMVKIWSWLADPDGPTGEP